MTSFCDSLSSNAQLTCLYFAAVLLLLLLIIMQLWQVGYFMKKGEHMTGAVVGASNYTVLAPGMARSRGPSQVFSQPGQGDTHGQNDNGVAMLAAKGAREWLVSGRGEPDFWEISSELGEYKRSLASDPGELQDEAVHADAASAAVAAQAAAAAAPAKEWFTQPLFENYAAKKADSYRKEYFAPPGTRGVGSGIAVQLPGREYFEGEQDALLSALGGH